jgi:hypothetical protein
MFVVRTTEGLILGPFPSYNAAKEWAAKSVWANMIDDIYVLLQPREDMLSVRKNNGRPVVGRVRLS